MPFSIIEIKTEIRIDPVREKLGKQISRNQDQNTEKLLNVKDGSDWTVKSMAFGGKNKSSFI